MRKFSKSFSEEWLKNYEAGKNKNLQGKHRKADRGIQKQQNPVKRKDVHQSRSKTKKGSSDHDTHRTIIANFRVSDKRTRDIDGSLNTFMDSLTQSGIIPDDSSREVQRILAGITREEQNGVDIVIIEIFDA